MKKLSLLMSGIAVLTGIGTVQAAFNGPGNAPVVTVEQAKAMTDDTHVVMQGYIVQHLGGEDYMFKDATGTIRVEIDDDDWKGLDVTDKNLVEIRGEVDTHLRKPTNIEADSIRLVK